jgi:hypothetical protein
MCLSMGETQRTAVQTDFCMEQGMVVIQSYHCSWWMVFMHAYGRPSKARQKYFILCRGASIFACL